MGGFAILGLVVFVFGVAWLADELRDDQVNEYGNELNNILNGDVNSHDNDYY